MCYLGGAWPAEYRGQLFMGNIHGRRINMDILKPKGSGYVASHGKDLLHANDAWARFINMRYGPDGNIYLIDWYDKQACHLQQPEAFDELGLDPEHPPGVGVHPVGRPPAVEQPLVRRGRRYLLTPQSGRPLAPLWPAGIGIHAHRPPTVIAPA